MTNEPSSEAHDKELIIDAICINCNKRFTSIRGVSMHLKMTAARHAVNFLSYGNYDNKTGLREMNFNRITYTHSRISNPRAIHNSRIYGAIGPKEGTFVICSDSNVLIIVSVETWRNYSFRAFNNTI